MIEAPGRGTAGWRNPTSGHVANPEARTVRVSVPGEAEPVVAEVGRLGFFAQLPDSMLRSQEPPVLTAEAVDEDGHVVARSRVE